MSSTSQRRGRDRTNLDSVIKAFQTTCESGYIKTSTLTALDWKIKALDIDTSMEMGIRKDLHLVRQVVPVVEEPETTFEINRAPRTSGSGPAPSLSAQSAISVQLPEPENQVDDLETRLNEILGQSYSA